jgi:hypothetical protein
MRHQIKRHPRRQRECIADCDFEPVLVPRNDKALVTTPPERARRLREHLLGLWHAMRERGTAPSPLRTEPEGFAARVTQTACALCGGWCCRNGSNDAFLDEGTLARVAGERPHLDTEAVLKLYTEKVPEVGFERSCIFHGKQGCTLDRALRSDVCNAYFCGGLLAYTQRAGEATATVIIAGEADKTRTSPVLLP